MFVDNTEEDPSDNIQNTLPFIYIFSRQKDIIILKTPATSVGEEYKRSTLMACHAHSNSNAQTAFKEEDNSFAQECFTQKILK